MAGWLVIIITDEMSGKSREIISSRDQFVEHVSEPDRLFTLGLGVRLESIEDEQQVSVAIAAIEFSVDIKSKILECEVSLSPQVFGSELGLLQLPQAPTVVHVLVPVLLADPIGEDHSVDEFLVRMAHRHEWVYLVIPGHEDFPHLGKRHAEAFILELTLESVPLLGGCRRVFAEEVLDTAEHVLGVAEVLVQGDLFDQLLEESGLVGQELAVEVGKLQGFCRLEWLEILGFLLQFWFAFCWLFQWFLG